MSMSSSFRFPGLVCAGITKLFAGWLILPLALAAQTELEAVATYGVIGVGRGEPADALGSAEVRFAPERSGIRPWLGYSMADNGTWFAGGGLLYDFAPSRSWVVTLGTGPFYYWNRRNDLGLDLEFYSFIEATRRFRNDIRVGVRAGHLSNGGFGRRNPGRENVALVAVFPLALPHARESTGSKRSR
jgi:hypothetical protein